MTPADAGIFAARQDARITSYELTGCASNVDTALYQASCLAGSTANRTSLIYYSTKPQHVYPETGEGYWIIRGDDPMLAAKLEAEGWEHCYTITSHVRR